PHGIPRDDYPNQSGVLQLVGVCNNPLGFGAHIEFDDVFLGDGLLEQIGMIIDELIVRDRFFIHRLASGERKQSVSQ
ncbi:hypothetical protein, partial [Pseudomonas syringae group genomosp. 7]|uniref:hypothetical protein n=1 Tax=Pseudomonas syringae group genomosp. 7 TaxID=251699 RepID=UPI00376F9109